MRAVGLGCVLAVACGGERAPAGKDAAPARDAAAVGIDAPVLPACAAPSAGTTLVVKKLAEGVNGFATFATAPRGDRRLFVLERGGTIRIYDADRRLLPAPFLDLGDEVTATAGEQGLLGLAFHPEYAANGLFYVFYTHEQVPAETPHPYRNVLAQCRRSAGDPDRAEPACTELLSIKDPATNHNGGMIEFGPDGYLYIGTGDGGGNARFNAQALVDGDGNANAVALLGKILRIDVDHPAGGKPYGIPADNPFAAGGGAPEIYALGLRNPWRWSFDAATGDMWIGDVGQSTIEEVDVVPAGELRGKNFGWAVWEGSRCIGTACDPAGFTFPQIERTHGAPPGNGWSAVIGGAVYRGTCFPDLAGTYVFANFGTRMLATATRAPDGTVTVAEITAAAGDPPFPGGITSIHADAAGELYLTTTSSGLVFALAARP